MKLQTDLHIVIVVSKVVSRQMHHVTASPAQCGVGRGQRLAAVRVLAALLAVPLAALLAALPLHDHGNQLLPHPGLRVVVPVCYSFRRPPRRRHGSADERVSDNVQTRSTKTKTKTSKQQQQNKQTNKQTKTKNSRWLVLLFVTIPCGQVFSFV